MANLILILVSTLLIISLALSEPSRRDEDGEKHTKHKEKDKNEDNKTMSESPDVKNQSNHENEIPDVEDKGWEYENRTKVDTRRVLYSKTVGKGKRPYMIYLQLTKDSAKAHKYRGWLCGGVIVDRYYVLTSAACVEDADHFYVVSGTTKFVDSFDYKDNECVCNNRRKVVWKCIPKNYKFDFQDSIKWSSNDIAIVKVEKPFKFGVTEKGCEFATDLICYNNVSRDLEKPGTKGFIAGWGSGSNFREGVYRRQKPYNTENAKCLQEAKVCIMDNEACAKKWSQRFREIITQFMICTKDVMKRLSEICDKRYANCTDVESRKSLNLDDSHELSSASFNVDVGRHLRDPDDYTARRSSMKGGFCENDHGGPLIVKYQNKERVIGVISACKIDPKSHSCHGPFLYTSVFKNRQFISCSIFKDVEESCRRVFRSGITHEEWSVNWDNIKEDDESPKEEKNEARAVEDDNSDSDDRADSHESKEALRENKSEEKKSKVISKEKSTTVAAKVKRTGDSSDSSSSTSGEKSEEVKKKEKSKKKKSKTKSEKSEKKHSRSHKSSKKSKKSKGSGEPNLRSHDRKELFYESSRDENVNEPDDDE